jgi:hypothetical protein
MADDKYKSFSPGTQGTGSSAGAGSGAGAQDVPAGTRERSDPYQTKPGHERDREAEKQLGKDAFLAKHTHR